MLGNPRISPYEACCATGGALTTHNDSLPLNVTLVGPTSYGATAIYWEISFCVILIIWQSRTTMKLKHMSNCSGLPPLRNLTDPIDAGVLVFTVSFHHNPTFARLSAMDASSERMSSRIAADGRSGVYS